MMLVQFNGVHLTKYNFVLQFVTFCVKYDRLAVVALHRSYDEQLKVKARRLVNPQ